MFQGLAARFQTVFRHLRGEGRLDERTLSGGLREMRRALLEADVNLMVIRGFLQKVKERALEEKLSRSWTAAQKLQAIVQEELVRLLSGADPQISLGSRGEATCILVVGLQGTGKTTTVAKLGQYLLKRGKTPLLVAADTRRPAARQQLFRLSEKAGVACFPDTGEFTEASALEICRGAMDQIRERSGEVAVIDTAGRMHLDDELMRELVEIRQATDPAEVLFVADALTGQDAVKSSQAFHQAVGLTGIILSKLDGDSRGGAALSAVSVTGVPIKMCGTGEGPGDLEPFDPQRMASRILGLGDLQGLVKTLDQSVPTDGGAADPMPAPQNLDLDQFRTQLARLRQAGPLKRILEMLPGGMSLGDLSGSEDQMRETTAILDSMTSAERADPDLLNGSRRRRIARGSGTSLEKVNRLLKQFSQVRKILQSPPSGRLAGFRMAGRGRITR